MGHTASKSRGALFKNEHRRSSFVICRSKATQAHIPARNAWVGAARNKYHCMPFAAIAPMIVVSCAVGAYAIQNAVFDI